MSAGQSGAAQTGAQSGIGSRLAPARFLVFLAVFIGAALAWHYGSGGKWADALTLGFDAGAALFLVSLWPIWRVSAPAELRAHARDNDANRVLVLVITVAIVLAVLAALTGELPQAAKGNVGAILRLIGALSLAWLFANAVFALHYAHLYYNEDPRMKGSDCKGLDFPGDEEPLLPDFLYFSATLGMTFQTSDTEITGRHMRSVVLGHSLAAFAFNLGIIALVINALGGLASGGSGG